MKRFFYRHQPKTTPRAAIIAGFGSALAIIILAILTDSSGYVLLMAPFGASCVLIFGFYSSPFSQPANVIGGHVLSAAIGLALHFILPANLVVDGVAVGLAVSGMMLLRIVHPPAGAAALVAYLSATSWMFLLFPVLVGSVILVAIATIYHAVVKTSYPHPISK